MASLSAGDAMGAGFALIRRRPLSVFVWGLFAVAAVYLPMIPALGAVVPAYLELMQVSLHPGAQPDVAHLMAIETRLFGAMMWMWPLGLAAATINVAAVFRAVLEPNNRGFAYLRVGMQEVWLAVLMLVEFLLVMVFVAGAGLVVALLCVAAARFMGSAMAVVTGVAGGFASVILLFWIGLRLSLAAPMTFADRRLRLFESWPLTRGHAGQLLLLAVLLLVILMGVGLVLQVIEGLGFLFFDPFTVRPDAVRAWLAHPPAMTVWGPWAAGCAAVLAVYIGVVRAIMSRRGRSPIGA